MFDAQFNAVVVRHSGYRSVIDSLDYMTTTTIRLAVWHVPSYRKYHSV